jgi:hypothetical protein
LEPLGAGGPAVRPRAVPASLHTAEPRVPTPPAGLNAQRASSASGSECCGDKSRTSGM